MRWNLRALLFGVILALASPAQAEVTWLDGDASYRLSGAALFNLRGELPPELQESLKAIRNQSFDGEQAFRDALGPALLTDAFRAEWSDRLIAAAKGQSTAFGIETRADDVLTLYVAGGDHALDSNPFTSQSWLTDLPAPANATSFNVAEEADGCLRVMEGNAHLFSLCAPEVTESGTAIVMHTEAEQVYGLGQEFQTAGATVANRIGSVRHGSNSMVGFNGGANGNTLFPIAYFDVPEHPFALILDNRYQQEWDFSQAGTYRLRVWGGDLRLHLITGDTLADIRRSYMAMTGHPPVPPKAAFGLWISEYGYDDWAELEDKIASLKANGFPLSGVVMDLNWFGGINSSSISRMGSLTWDEVHFPDPAGKIAELAAEGIGLMPIEESYISAGLPEYAALAEHHALAHDAAGAPLIVNAGGSWWGTGGMVDWTSISGRDFWHDFRRQPLIDMGIAGHWTDLGEPEMVNPDFQYGDGLVEAQVHNSYNLLWLQGIFDGYQRNSPGKRPFMISRSGGMGMQMLGAVMWSGDTGGAYGSLAAQMPQQTHMMWSGLDYYGSDIGGFHRSALGSFPSTDDAMNELYTQWFAYSAMFEVPVRPHTENLCNCKETAPDRIGDLASNRANIELRYALLPYYYSLAYQAWRWGEPVFPALDYVFPAVPAATGLGHEKMIGPSLLSAAVAAHGAQQVEIYLPAGDWYNFRSGAKVTSAGEAMSVPVYEDGLLQLPLLARDGAIVPEEGGVLHIFGAAQNRFEWYDDDGGTTAYRRGGYQLIRVYAEPNSVQMIRAAGIALRPKVLHWVRPDATPITKVIINTVEVPFEQQGAELTVTLPPFGEQLFVTLE
jgi:alpha-glucosidase (family GH31 glycosyl hydrolase)